MRLDIHTGLLIWLGLVGYLHYEATSHTSHQPHLTTPHSVFGPCDENNQQPYMYW
jgi:hypothetical protein